MSEGRVLSESRPQGGKAREAVSLALAISLSIGTVAVCLVVSAMAADYLDQRRAAETVRIVSIDTEELLARFIAEQATGGIEGAALEEATLAWSRRFDAVVSDLQARHNLVLIDRKAVAAGVEDVTNAVAQALH